MGSTPTDVLWVLTSAALVFLMQAGFLCLETGLTRSKNNINVAIKNLVDFSLSALVFWAVGFAIMFGASATGLVGIGRLFPSFDNDLSQAAFFIFQLMFASTAVTIISGAVAERLRFRAYMLLAIFLSALIYPIFGHWVWGGGWLQQLGFYDFAGASAVHSFGGWAALAVLIIIGPRTGRFSSKGIPNVIPASSIPLAALGTLLLFIGWFGFNGGSNLALDARVGKILLNTLLGGVAGMITSVLFNWTRDQQPHVGSIINGVLAGLVAVTASANSISALAALLIGAIGGIITYFGERVLERFQIDDVVAAIPVHLFAGTWGLLAVALFVPSELLANGRIVQFGVQLLGIVVCGAWTFGTVWAFSALVNRGMPLRVSAEEEHLGLNMSEHGANNGYVSLLAVLDQQSKTGDLSLRAPEDSFTQVGQIAKSYNRVISKLAQTREQSETIIDGAMDGIITFRQDDLGILVANPAAETIFGRDRADLIGQSVTTLIDAALIDDPLALLSEVVRIGKPAYFTARRYNDDPFPIETVIATALIDDVPVYIATVRDITERQAVQAKLEQLNDELVEASRHQEAFVAAMSHELRTPLNGILGISQALSANVYGQMSDRQQNATEKITDSGRHLLELIDDILDISKISADEKPLETHALPISYICDASLSMIRPLAEKKGIRIRTKFDEQVVTIAADARRLKQILINLLNNAIKFTPSGGRVGLMVVGAASTQEVHFVVWDTGIGIPPERINDIFKPFVQLDDSPTRQFGGVGLGLALVKQLVALHGGTLDVQSQVGEGSRFIVTLPWAKELQTRPNAPISSSDLSIVLPESKISSAVPISATDIAAIVRPEKNGAAIKKQKTGPPTILLAEDNEANIITLSDYLSMHGFEVSVARDGLEAVEMAEEVQPDLVLMDIQMPHMDGIEAIEHIRRTYSEEMLPIIALTALAMPGDRERCLQVGATDYLSKPIGLAQLVRAIRGQLAP